MGKTILWIGAISWLKDGRYDPPVHYPGIVSASAFQQSIIEELECEGYRVQLLTDADVSDGQRIEWKHSTVNSKQDIRIAGCKNRLLRLPIKAWNLCREIQKNKLVENNDIAIAYEIHIPYLLALRRIKKSHPDVKSVLICPDLTIYMDIDIKNKPIKRVLKAVENRLVRSLMVYVDGYVFFTKQMEEYFEGRLKRPSTVVEGVFGSSRYNLNDVPKPVVSYIMHSGSLHSRMGIEELIEAFENMKHLKMDLLFFGSGEMDEYIREEGKKDPRIKHMGFVSPQELFEYEKAAALLVNVRSPNETYTKYSFPSKTFEYMASGTPLLTTNMQGIPEEYKKHLIVIENNSAKEIEAAIGNTFDMPYEEQRKIGAQAREFVICEKAPKQQCKKIIDLINKLQVS